MNKISLLIIITIISSLLQAQERKENRAEFIRSHYSKFEYQIPMRDGVKLFTSIYIPLNKSKKYPILLLRTPYTVAPYGADKYKKSLGPTEAYEKEGFIFVFQDVRGKFMSEGQYVNMRPHIDNKKSKKDIDESSDTYDTIEWLLQNIDEDNGKVGMWGISYPGFYASAGAIDSHPALKAVSPQAPIADWFWDDMHHNGAFTLAMGFRFFSSFGVIRDSLTTKWPKRFDYGTPDGYEFYLDLGSTKNANNRYFKEKIPFWNDFTKHPDYDQFWQSRNILPHLKDIDAAVLVVGGLFDAEDLYGPLKTYRAIEKNNSGIQNTIVMGPWSHGGWARTNGDKLGDLDFGFNTSKYYQENIELNFFRHYLKDGSSPNLPEAYVFETGANRWREFDQWPPKEAREKSLFLQEDMRLSFMPPTSESEAFAEYLSDPAHPVPYTKSITTRWEKKYMAEDQRFAGSRPDVLSFSSEVLKEDLTIAGPLNVDLWVSTTGTDADWVVKLIDIFPGDEPNYTEDDTPRGSQQVMIRGDIFRGRYRDSFSEPKPFIPNKVTRIKYELQDILHTFKRGHKIMIQIQSTWFPMFDRNPQKYVENIFEAKDEDFIKAFHRVYFDKHHPSQIIVGVLK